ncbi:MAG: DUF2510 domain-containing protein [Nitriliruptoraceae bacterium]
MENPAAWHPDPLGRHELRYWDGQLWTEHVSDGGVTAVDPIDEGPDPTSDVTSDATSDVTSDAAPDSTAGSTPQQQPAVSTPATGSPAPPVAQVAAAAATQAVNRIATTALVVGILALIFAIIPVVGVIVGSPLGLFAIIAGAIGLIVSKKSGKGRGASIAGLILGGLALIVVVVWVVVFNRLTQDWQNLMGPGGENILEQIFTGTLL